MDLDFNEPKSKDKESNVPGGGAGDVDDDHSLKNMKFGGENTEKLLKRASESTEDFEHVDSELLINFAKSAQEQEKETDNASLMDDFVGSMKNQYDSIKKQDFGDEVSKVGASFKESGVNILSEVESKFQEKINQTKDFMAAERGTVEIQKPKESKEPLGPDRFDDLNFASYPSSSVNKLIKEDNEKFISSEDLLGDYKEEHTKTPELHHSARPDQKSESENSSISEPVKQSHEKFISSGDLLDDFKNDHTKTPEIESHQQREHFSKQINKGAEEMKENKLIGSQKSALAELQVTSMSTTEKKSEGGFGSPKPMISAEEMFCRYGLDVWFKPERLHPQVESLIYWRDVKKSGIVFGTGLVILLAISCFSVISVFAYLSLLALSGTIAFRIYKTILGAVQKTSEGHPFKEYLEFDLTLSQEKVQQIVNVAVAHVNGFVSELRRLFLVEDLVDSLKFGVILWVLTYIGAWFNGMTLVILAFVALFTLPKVYENNKQSIDTYLDLVRSKFLEITDKVKAAVPIGKKPETDKDK